MHPAGAYADSLLAALPAVGAEPSAARLEHPALAWARSGAMLLTGRADEPPRLAPAPLATCAAAALDALCALAPKSRLALEAAGDGARGLDGAALLGERAAYLGLSPPRRDLPGRELPPAARSRRLDRRESPARRGSRAASGVARGRRVLVVRSVDARRVPRSGAERRRGRRARPPRRPRRVGGRRPRRRRAALAACGRARRAPRRRGASAPRRSCSISRRSGRGRSAAGSSRSPEPAW